MAAYWNLIQAKVDNTGLHKNEQNKFSKKMLLQSELSLELLGIHWLN